MTLNEYRREFRLDSISVEVRDVSKLCFLTVLFTIRDIMST